MTPRAIVIDDSWKNLLGAEFSAPYMQSLSEFLRVQKQRGKRIYPPGKEIFAAFDHTPVEDVKVVIIGQDPYHGPGQAHGLCFSVRDGVPLPPSLVNIYKEIEQDLGLGPMPPGVGCLEAWADQGVLLLNSVLTVEAHRAGSHQGKGWEQFTDAVVDAIATRCTGVVFMLWGSYAQKKGAVVDRKRHCVLTAPHPSPLSAHRGFFGCKHFSQANAYLEQQHKQAIDWYAVGPSSKH